MKGTEGGRKRGRGRRARGEGKREKYPADDILMICQMRFAVLAAVDPVAVQICVVCETHIFPSSSGSRRCYWVVFRFRFESSRR